MFIVLVALKSTLELDICGEAQAHMNHIMLPNMEFWALPRLFVQFETIVDTNGM